MIIYNDNENNLTDCVETICSFEIITNGKKKTIGKNNFQFKSLLNNIEDLFLNSHLMPAFGVSLHDETLNEIQKGKWLQINFDKEISKNELCFNSLLFKLEEVQGFNLIRLFNDKYEGRCLYLDLDNLTDLTNLI